jgi:hypothetical protein
MESFVGLGVKQSEEGISLYLDTYIQELIEEHRLLHKKFIKPKKVPMLPGLVPEKDDCPAIPDPFKQKLHRSMIAKIQFVAYWVRYAFHSKRRNLLDSMYRQVLRTRQLPRI